VRELGERSQGRRQPRQLMSMKKRNGVKKSHTCRRQAWGKMSRKKATTSVNEHEKAKWCQKVTYLS